MDIVPNWAEHGEEELPHVVTGHIESIRERQQWVYDNQKRLLDLYLGVNSRGRERYVRTLPEIMAKYGTYQCRLNIVSSLVDTIGNRITANAIKPWIIGTGGSWELGLRAKKLEKYLTGVFYRENYAELAKKAFFDAGIENIGYTFVGFDGEDVFLENLRPGQVIVDEEQADRGAVTELFVVRDYLPHELKRIYPDAASIIDITPHCTTSMDNETYRTSVVRVYEGWRLAVGKSPGVHFVCTTHGNIQEPEEYDCKTFPVVPMRWKRRPGHWIGMGVAESVYSMQLEIDREIARVQRCHELFGDPPILNDVRAKVPDEHLEQVSHGRILNYDSEKGNPPQPLVTQTISAEFPAWINQVAAWAHDVEGVSELSAQGQRPTGNDLSGFAFRILEDLQSMRLSAPELEWQRHAVDVAKQVIEVSARAYKNKKVKVKYVAKSHVETIDWSECADLDEQSYHVRIYPASIYPDQPKGRIETAERLLNAGLADPMEVRAQIYGPEAERMQSYHTAPIDDVNVQIDTMLVNGEYSSPTKYQDLDMGIRMVNSAYLRARVDGAPDDRLSLLLRWLDEADLIRKDMKKQAMLEMADMQQQMGGPQGQPKGPPQGGEGPAQQAAGQEMIPPPSE